MSAPSGIKKIVETEQEAKKIGKELAVLFEEAGTAPQKVEHKKSGTILHWFGGSKMRIMVGHSRMTLYCVQHAYAGYGEWKGDYQEKHCVATSEKGWIAFVKRVAPGLIKAEEQAGRWKLDQDWGHAQLRSHGWAEVEVEKVGTPATRNGPEIRVKFDAGFWVDLIPDSKARGFWFGYHWNESGKSETTRFLDVEQASNWIESMSMAVKMTELKKSE